MDPEDVRDEDDGDELEAEIMGANRPFGADRRGTTQEEAEAGLSLDEALARERADPPTTDDVVALEEADVPDDEAELIAEGAVEHDDFASPEESAVSIRERAPGATDHDDDYVVDDET